MKCCICGVVLVTTRGEGICIVPRNERSRRVMEKLEIRDEGIALRYLEINGVWEDHVRYGITAEEWDARRDDIVATWLER